MQLSLFTGSGFCLNWCPLYKQWSESPAGEGAYYYGHCVRQQCVCYGKDFNPVDYAKKREEEFRKQYPDFYDQ